MTRAMDPSWQASIEIDGKVVLQDDVLVRAAVGAVFGVDPAQVEVEFVDDGVWLIPIPAEDAYQLWAEWNAMSWSSGSYAAHVEMP